MKRTLAAMLTVLMLVTFLPLASPPAQAAENANFTFTVNFSVDPAQPAYAGETVELRIRISDGWNYGDFEYAYDIYKDGQLFAQERWSLHNYYIHYKFPSPGKYKVKGWVRDQSNNATYHEFSPEITVKPSINRITKVEPLGATSLRITWNKVPGAIYYDLYRSTDMKNWKLIKTITSGTSFADTSLKTGTRYFYRMFYYREEAFGSGSPVVAGVPMARTRITSLASPSARRIRMTWARAAGASGYQVAMASRATGNYKTVRIVTGGTTAIFSGVKSGSALFFKVRPYRRIYTTTYWGQYSAYRSVRVK